MIVGVTPNPSRIDHDFDTFKSKLRLLCEVEDKPLARSVVPLLRKLIDLLSEVIAPEWNRLEAAQSTWNSEISCAAMVIDSVGDLVDEVIAGVAQLNLQKLVRRFYNFHYPELK